MLNADRVVLENPIGRLGPVFAREFGIRPQIIQPYQFGEDASKATCLFEHNVPPLQPTKFVAPRMVCKCGNVYRESLKERCPACGIHSAFSKPRWSNQTDSGQNKLAPSESRWMDRSRTYPGIAEAKAEQWGSL